VRGRGGRRGGGPPSPAGSAAGAAWDPPWPPVKVVPFLALRVVVAHAQLLALRTARSSARCRGRAATPATVSPSRGGSAGGWAAAESGRRRAAGGRQQGGVDGQRLGSWRSHAAGVRGGADQPESWAARVHRGGADGRFHTMESREEDELLPRTWSVTRGDAGAGRNRPATEAAAARGARAAALGG
jgi:hypothetical protein